jgi:hypothetical protein
MGSYAVASGRYSVAIGGYSLIASGMNSTVMGTWNIANSNSSVAIGEYNNDYYPANSNDVNRFLFTIGNGDSNTRRNSIIIFLQLIILTATVSESNEILPQVRNSGQYHTLEAKILIFIMAHQEHSRHTSVRRMVHGCSRQIFV